MFFQAQGFKNWPQEVDLAQAFLEEKELWDLIDETHRRRSDWKGRQRQRCRHEDHQARGQLKLLELRCHAQLGTTPQFGMADWNGPIPISGS